MALPTIVTRAGKGAALTYQELDDNFTNLQTATTSLTAGTGGVTVTADLNGTITLVAGNNITLTGDDTAKTITIAATAAGLDLNDTLEVGQPDTDTVFIIANDTPTTKDLVLKGRNGTTNSPASLLLGSTNASLFTAGQLTLQATNIYETGTKRLQTTTVNSVSGSYTFNWYTGTPVYLLKLVGDTTFIEPPAMSEGSQLEVYIQQDSTGSRIATWPTSFKFADGYSDLSVGANAIDRLFIRKVGNLFLCDLAANFS